MIALLQRVTQASVTIDGICVAEIGCGLLAFIAVEPADHERHLIRMADKLLGYRIFADEHDRMNLNVMQSGGGVLLVPQFTLAANTDDGLRPNFSTAARPEMAREYFTRLATLIKERHQPVACGVFGADMAVALVNAGPATFHIRIS
jgi:D-tyrosyl-tRNA(Tyr) deacylase